MLFLGCFYSLFVTEYHERDRKGSLVDHYLCITVTAAHLICYWTSWSHIEPVFGKRSKQKLLCIFYTQLARPAGQRSTIGFPYIASKSYNCYRCHFPKGRNFLRFFSKSPRPNRCGLIKDTLNVLFSLTESESETWHDTYIHIGIGAD